MSLISLALVFLGLAQCDLPLALFLRSVHVPWLDQVGHAGNFLGDGWVLVVLSVSLLAIGLLFKSLQFRRAGFQSLIAHALAGLLVQSLKRLIGRPRPRFTHGEDSLLAPSLTSGFDSFPSGHTAASFAVAAVLARHFPRAAWMLYGVAGLIGISRVLGGSHFSTDVAMGAILGLLLGLLVVTLRGFRWKTFMDGLIGIAPYLAGSVALLWIAMQPSQETTLDRVAFAAGTVIVLLGVGSRLSQSLASPDARVRLRAVSLPMSNGLIVAGLALSTGSLLVLVLGVLVSLSWWLVSSPASEPTALLAEGRPPAYGPSGGIYAEATLAALLMMGLVVIMELKGVLPLL